MEPVASGVNASNLVTAQSLAGLRNAAQAGKAGQDSPRAGKLRHAAEEFESMLVSSWWQEMYNSFKDSSDQDSDPGADTLQTMGIQSTTTAIAKSGGLGIARMMFHQLQPALADSKPGAE